MGNAVKVQKGAYHAQHQANVLAAKTIDAKSPSEVPAHPPKNSKVAFAVVTAGYDAPFEILEKDEDTDYLILTDDPSLNMSTWTTVVVPKDETHGAQYLSRIMKIKPETYLPRRYDKSLYIDGNVEIAHSLKELFEKVGPGKADVGVYRFSVMEMFFKWDMNREAGFQEKLMSKFISEPAYDGRFREGDVHSQLERYEKDVPGYKDHWAYYGKVILRHHNQKTRKFENVWWKEFSSGVPRDQLSLPYATLKSEVKVEELNEGTNANPIMSLWDCGVHVSCMGSNDGFKRWFVWHHGHSDSRLPR